MFDEVMGVFYGNFKLTILFRVYSQSLSKTYMSMIVRSMISIPLTPNLLLILILFMESFFSSNMAPLTDFIVIAMSPCMENTITTTH